MATSSYRTLDLTLVSAQDLKDVNLLSRLEVYAAATLSNDPRTRQRTQTDRIGGRNPTWNSTLRFSVPSNAVDWGVSLVITLHADRALGDRLVGKVRIPIKELLADSASTSTVRRVSYQVRRPSGSAKGVLNLSYKFSDTVSYPAAASTYPPQTKLDAPAEEPVTAYPVYPPYTSAGAVYPPTSASAGTASAYQMPPAGHPKYQQASQAYGYGAVPPSTQAYGYGAVPPSTAGYGYPAPAYGAYPPQAMKPAKKNRLGLGLGAGLLGGALGGLLIGDAIGDAVAYDAGYDGGFGDAGFDFGF